MRGTGRVILEGVCYHIITRGNQKQNVFIQENDCEEYLKRVKYYKRKYKFRLYGYCLMPNHIHLFGEIGRKEDLAKFMQGVSRSYTAHFNEIYDKVGHLWQGRFKSKIIIKDQCLINCISYIELNPIRTNMVQFPQEYKWSSFAERNLNVAKEKQLLDSLSL